MNAPFYPLRERWLDNANFAETEEAVSAAFERANDWLRVARPVIKAYLALDEIDSVLRTAAYDFRGHKPWNEPKEWEERSMDEAREILRKPVREMHEMIDAIRQSVIDDEMPRWTTGCDTDAFDAEYERYEQAFADVLTVDQAIKIVGDEL